MEFTREQLGAIEDNALGDDNNAWVSQLADGTEFGFTVSSLAAFALDVLERAESAEAERDILAWANRHMVGGPVEPNPIKTPEYYGSFNVVYDNDVAAECGGDARECSKREPKGEWVGDGEWWSEPAGELLTSEPSRPHESLVWAMLLSQVARGDRAYPCGFALEVLIQDVDRLLDIWRKRWPEPGA